MSQSRTIRYACPYCGKEIEAEIYDSVTGEFDEFPPFARSGEEYG